MLWTLLLRGRIAALIPGVLLVLSIAAALGAVLGGWKGAVIAPLVTIVLAALAIHVTLSFLVRRGKRAHAQGDHWKAWRYLSFLQLPFLGRYDRDGEGRRAFQAASAWMAGGMLRNAVGKFLKR